MVSPARILVVDDEPTVTKGCRRVLGDAGYSVDTAATGRDGLRRAMDGDFDLVMADLRLPDLNGMELVRAVRAKRPEVAVVIITGYGSVPNAVEAMRLGVLDYIEKPFTPEEITRAVGRVVETRRRETVTVDANLVKQVLRLAGRDPNFGRRLLEEGSRVLSGYALPAAAKAAIASGDLAWIEKETGELTGEERAWLDRRLESETW